MKFQKHENELIWESAFQNKDKPDIEIGFGDFDDDLDNDFEPEEDGSEVVMELEPMGEVEPSFEDEGDDAETEAVATALRVLVKRSNALMDLVKEHELESWMIAKIIKAETYISSVWDDLDDVVDFANDSSDDVRF